MNKKANKQAIIDIIRMKPVWESEEDTEKELHYYHITDALNRKWQTIGLNVSDAIQVFENGNDDNWTRIIEPAPYNPDLSTNDLFNMLNISPEATGIRNDMQIILNTVERRNEYVSRIVNVNRESRFLLLHQMKYSTINLQMNSLCNCMLSILWKHCPYISYSPLILSRIGNGKRLEVLLRRLYSINVRNLCFRLFKPLNVLRMKREGLHQVSNLSHDTTISQKEKIHI
ncbi:hypothetical protein [Paenibacillus terrae]|uniref:hypothetical protein n=1 Tax=Paenibacillus terrae TaxID=159743 RepID=UPI00030B86AA|nr:hypothetical protein [Paenibacillus terrae]